MEQVRSLSGLCPPRLYLMRHSQAVSADFQIRDDARWLSAKGRIIAEQAGLALQEHCQTRPIKTIVTSPLVRTTQSAELIAQKLAWTDVIESREGLRSEVSAQSAVEELQALGASVLLAVSHEPLVSTMCMLLQGQGLSASGAGFHPAEIRCFEDGQLIWHWRY